VSSRPCVLHPTQLLNVANVVRLISILIRQSSVHKRLTMTRSCACGSRRATLRRFIEWNREGVLADFETGGGGVGQSFCVV